MQDRPTDSNFTGTIEAAQKIRFQPAVQNCKPVNDRGILQFNFDTSSPFW